MTTVRLSESAPPAPLPRYHFLDWVRILAFFLLILYHVGMYYVTWGWHVKSPYASDALEPYMMLSAPWRLSLLFLVSGVASSCMLTKLSLVRCIFSVCRDVRADRAGATEAAAHRHRPHPLPR